MRTDQGSRGGRRFERQRQIGALACVGEMRVQIDQTWKHSVSRPVDAFGIFRGCGALGDGGDFVIGYADAFAAQDFARDHINELTGFDIKVFGEERGWGED